MLFVHPAARQLGEGNWWERVGYGEVSVSELHVVFWSSLYPHLGGLTSWYDVGWGSHCGFMVPQMVVKMTLLLQSL